MEALDNSDPEVRSAAAWKLASDRDKAAISSIVKALHRYQNVKDQINLGSALTQLGNGAGLEALRNVCKSNEKFYEKLEVTRHLLDFGDESCMDTVISGLRDTETDTHIQALALVPRIRYPSKDIIDLVSASLTDKNPGARMSAATAFGDLGNQAGVANLQTVIARETDANVQSFMQTELRRLGM